MLVVLAIAAGASSRILFEPSISVEASGSVQRSFLLILIVSCCPRFCINPFSQSYQSLDEPGNKEGVKYNNQPVYEKVDKLFLNVRDKNVIVFSPPTVLEIMLVASTTLGSDS